MRRRRYLQAAALAASGLAGCNALNQGTEETPNANFVRVDWDWYLSHDDTDMRFGTMNDEDWTLEVNAGNLKAPESTEGHLHV